MVFRMFFKSIFYKTKVLCLIIRFVHSTEVEITFGFFLSHFHSIINLIVVKTHNLKKVFFFNSVITYF